MTAGFETFGYDSIDSRLFAFAGEFRGGNHMDDRDAVRFEKAHSEHRISRLKLLAAIERDRMDRLRKKIRKDNFGGSVSKPILNHKMIQYWYYVKLYKKFLASANMSAFTPMII